MAFDQDLYNQLVPGGFAQPAPNQRALGGGGGFDINALLSNPMLGMGLSLMGGAGNIGQPGYQGNPMQDALGVAMQMAFMKQRNEQSKAAMEQDKAQMELQAKGFDLQNRKLEASMKAEERQMQMEQDRAQRFQQGIGEFQKLLQSGGSPTDIYNSMLGILGMESYGMRGVLDQLKPRTPAVSVNVGGDGGPAGRSLSDEEAAGYGLAPLKPGNRYWVNRKGDLSTIGDPASDTEVDRMARSQQGIGAITNLAESMKELQSESTFQTGPAAAIKGEILGKWQGSEEAFVKSLQDKAQGIVQKDLTGAAGSEIELRRIASGWIPQWGDTPEQIDKKTNSYIEYQNQLQRFGGPDVPGAADKALQAVGIRSSNKSGKKLGNSFDLEQKKSKGGYRGYGGADAQW